jgi:hypothetical protein
MSEATSTSDLLFALINGSAPVIFGAVLAVGGGWISDEIRAWRERSREITSIKTAIAAELGEIVTTVDNMNEVWRQANMLPPAYIPELRSSTTIFDELRKRLFLLQEEDQRKIVGFYKKFKDVLLKAEGKVGTLAETEEARNEQSAFHNDFNQVGDAAKQLKKDLKPLSSNH